MFKGSMVALVTPMRVDGSIDYDCAGKLIDWHCEQGTDAIVAVGTTGESATLDFAEHEQFIRFTVDQVQGRLPLIAGTGANATKEAIHLTEQANAAGADACLLVTPYYNKPTQEGLYQHYKAIADAVPIPQILYNVPGRTAVDMQPATVQRLAQVDNIVGIKEASSLERILELVSVCPEDFAVLSGDDDKAMRAILGGGKGVISVTANVAPAAMHELCTLSLAGDEAGAAKVNEQLGSLHKSLFLESNPIPVKWALSEMGMIGTGIRLPLTNLAAEHHAPLLAALKEAGVV